MSYNSPVFDHVAYYEGKTTKELYELKQFYIDRTETLPFVSLLYKNLDLINKTLADRIGRKK